MDKQIMSLFMSDFCLYLCLYGHKKKPVMVVGGVYDALTAKISLFCTEVPDA